MEKIQKVFFALVVVAIMVAGSYYMTKFVREKQFPEHFTTMKIASSAFEFNGSIPPKYTCDGEDMSPPLKFSQVPEEAKSLVLIVDDPDVPQPGSLWVHWVVFNIPPETTEIAENRQPAGVAGNSSFDRTGYGGPCPPDREHRYFFKLYALDTELDLPAGSTKEQIEAAMQGHILEEAELVGRYERQ